MLTLLNRISQAVSAAPDLQQALTLLVQQVCHALKADACSVFLCDDVHGEYVLMAAQGLIKANVGHVRLKFGEGLIGLVGEREEPINIANAVTHPNFYRHPEFAENEFHAFLGVPIIDEGELLGVLIVQQRKKRVFDEEIVAFCMTLAIQLASIIARAKAKGLLKELNQEIASNKKISYLILEGVPGAPGIAFGEIAVLFPLANLEAVPDQQTESTIEEIEKFDHALVAAKNDIVKISAQAQTTLSAAEKAIFDAYLTILSDPGFYQEVLAEIQQGHWAPGALKRVIKKHIWQLESLEDGYLKERAADFRDLAHRILFHLQNETSKTRVLPKKTILVGEEITASALLEIPANCLMGIISGSGSGNSHVAILARALGLPAVMGVTGLDVTELAGQECIVDGYQGQIYIAPTPALKKEFRHLAQEEKELDESLQALRDSPAKTRDKHTIKLFINTGLTAEGVLMNTGAEGIGLYRTELPFMAHDRFPSEEEQRKMYRKLLQACAPQPVVMRTLDIGGDKNLPYFVITEENPFLGWRGIRVMLDHPEIFLQQVRAMLHASEGLNNLSLLLPMISSTREIEAALQLIQQVYEELVQDGLAIDFPAIGAMIEVPAAVYQAGAIAKRVDFLSVGSNDLIQYLLAVDRNNSRVANLYDGLHPAVIHALQQVVKAGHKAKKPVTICGELAADPVAAVLLLGMGFDAFSMNARSIPRIKWIIRKFTFEKAQQLLREALKMDDPTDIRWMIEQALEKAGLGGLIRAGN